MEQKVVQQWFAEDGDKTHLLNHDLTGDSIVFDVGGYLGEFTLDIYNKFKCNVYVFEPILEFYNVIKSKFEDNPKVKVYNFGLSDKTRMESFYINGDATSAYTKRGKHVTVELKNINEFLDENSIDKVDLIKINIEGEEYPLLDHIINTKTSIKFDNIQVQFHNFINDSINRKELINNELTKTHESTYQFEFVWENWKLKV